MKGIFKIGVLMLTLVLFNTTEGLAQKFGHLNSGLVLSMLPESKAAESRTGKASSRRARIIRCTSQRGRRCGKEAGSVIKAYLRKSRYRSTSSG